jgi:hypothetical protein
MRIQDNMDFDHEELYNITVICGFYWNSIAYIPVLTSTHTCLCFSMLFRYVPIIRYNYSVDTTQQIDSVMPSDDYYNICNSNASAADEYSILPWMSDLAIISLALRHNSIVLTCQVTSQTLPVLHRHRHRYRYVTFIWFHSLCHCLAYMKAASHPFWSDDLYNYVSIASFSSTK